MKPSPLTFAEDRHEAIWGYERWLVSAHPSAPSVVTGGPFAGRRLDDLCESFGSDLLGMRVRGSFPLLIKDIVAKRRLSMQVHPNEDTCRTVGGEPKSELWHVLDVEPGGTLFAGVRTGVTRQDLEKAIADGSIEDIVLRHDVAAGDNVFVPGGLVHAIDGGVRVLEIQQSSNTTFRLYDWGRVDAAGNARPLHVNEGLAAADLGATPVIVRGDFVCPFFKVRVLSPREETDMPTDPDTFRVLVAAQGGFALESDAGRQEIVAGGAILLPAVVSAAVIPFGGDVRILEVSV